MKLYEITEEHNRALREMSEIENLPIEVVQDTMESLKGEFREKAVSVTAFFMNQDADIQAMIDAEKRIAARRKTLERQRDALKNYLLHNMIKTGITKIECPYFKISVRTNPESVQVVDESKIPEDFKEYVETCKIDKRAIKQAGGCAGVEIVRSQSLSIK